MKLPVSSLDISAQLQEFDIWITPSLGEIKDSSRFQQELEIVEGVFEAIGSATNNFADITTFNVKAVAQLFVDMVTNEADVKIIQKSLNGLASVLFLVSGKSDNNVKCQLPIHFSKIGWANFPVIRSFKGKSKLAFSNIPRTLDAIRYMKLITDLKMLDGQPEENNGKSVIDVRSYQHRLLEEFIGFILSEESYVAQLWSIGHSYFTLKAFGKSRSLLTPLVIFQVRGSVAASGGHEPERRLRRVLEDWGLTPGVDFNVNDVILEKVSGRLVPKEVKEPKLLPSEELVEGIEESSDNEIKAKTRAYDFALPYKSIDWNPKILVQSQFYAGDAGSVSHKNVDQTDKSRSAILQLETEVSFIEYVDGAGYFSSLNGDLKKLLQKPTTTSFFQVRSAAIRLRREFQQIGFLLPIELEQSVFITDGNKASIEALLLSDGYSLSEIKRCLVDSIKRGLITEYESDRFEIQKSRRALLRRYLLLDIVAVNGTVLAPGANALAGTILIPGYGPWYGVKQDTMISMALALAPSLRKNDWVDIEIAFSDIRWLNDQGLIMTR